MNNNGTVSCISLIFKPIQFEDFSKIVEIYNYYVENTTATFHTEDVTIDDLKESIHICHPVYKSYCIYHNNELAGYCYLSQYKKKQAYNRTAEITIYLQNGFQGKGIGKFAIQKLEDECKNTYIKVIMGFITAENRASISLFQKCGYSLCAQFKGVGEKFGRILDVVGVQKILE